MIGPKKLIYAIDSAHNTKISVRELTKDFLKNKLGFEESEIEFFDKTEFHKDQAGVWQTKFTDEEQKRLNESARLMFGDK